MSEDFQNKSKYPISLNGIEIPSYRNNEERCVIKDVPFKESDFLGKKTFPTHVCYYYKCDSTPLEQKQRIIAEHKQRITCLLENVIKEEFDKFSMDQFIYRDNFRKLKTNFELNILPLCRILEYYGLFTKK